MKIKYHQQYWKNLQKLNKKLQQKACETVVKFARNPFDETLYNHSLHGKLYGYRSISVTGDIRIIFELLENGYKIVKIVNIGSHSQLYS